MVNHADQIVTRCSQCGIPIPPQGSTLGLTPLQRTIYHAVKTRPRSVDQLHDLLYAHDPNGGATRKIIHVVVCKINRRLREKKYGVRLRSINGVYYLVGAQETN